MNAARPYVTFVSYFRNDRYTSDFDVRVKRATHFLVRQLQHAAIPAELILVEWNPPGDRPRLDAGNARVPWRGGHAIAGAPAAGDRRVVKRIPI